MIFKEANLFDIWVNLP